jgi:hypothetical protein
LTDVISDNWYPLAADYWVPPDQEDSYPIRYGDLFRAPPLDVCRTAKGKPWSAVLVLQPSCELTAKAADDTQVLVARVNEVSDISAPQRPAVRVGWSEREGQVAVAHANAFWMPPHPAQGDDTDWYADFRRLQPVPLADLRHVGRLSAMTHDARVYLIRREIYFKCRWITPLGQIFDLERGRILNDSQFIGPRPAWAS